MDENGWIAREQILGPEARSKVPAEFQTQYKHYANPPTLFLGMQTFYEKLSNQSSYSGHPSEDLGDLESGKFQLTVLYVKLDKYYNWFCRTQAGNMTHYGGFNQGYRWRGLTPQQILTSGLDDYPRAASPNSHELHVDGLAWVGFMASVLTKVTSFLGDAHDARIFSKQKDKITRSIDGLHWSEVDQAYCDTTLTDESPVDHVCHKGYVSLLPFLTGLLPPDNPHLGAILDMVHDPEELWSPYGLRSLSRKDKFYGTGENYWRSPIWININYMAVEQLLHLAQQPGPHQQRAGKIYTELRINLVNTVYESWKETGFAWEQYNPDTGKGQRTQHFTGWTALIMKIMAMPEFPPPQASPVLGVRPMSTGTWYKQMGLMVVALLILTSLVFRRRFARLCSGLWTSRG